MKPKPRGGWCYTEFVDADASNYDPEWRYFAGGIAWPSARVAAFGPTYFRVIPHPDNDPEAVRMIEEARVATT